ncbi:hypothetical protein DFJ58DRAFT_859108 [Suillus subalutaceus]|uniref:uncharacterized protein n=1 Tax=Suillus subalutaceus TaxID=48586 RepID=UPI001B85F0F7|nr:uncharacterized protein DFJ58DRAFT_859108 [Suillus subalutaceus]KAG1839919.1 hypothetical protein DFJ58DRAFT_859108 [Suillus subalutaceus]
MVRRLVNYGQQSRLPSLNVNIPPTPGAYSPAAISAALSATTNATGRTVYVGNLPATASVDELLNLVHFGPLESIRVLPEKSSSPFTARKLKIGWGKPSPVSAQVSLAISQSNASRNVYLGGLDENTTEEQLRDDLSRFGLIDQVKIVRDKNIGFVHFLSISVATKVVNTLPTEPAWAGKRVQLRQGSLPTAQSLVAQSANLSPAAGPNHFGSPFSPYPFTTDMTGGQTLNRTVYLGNIHPETTTEDLCNAIRGGVLQSVRYMQDKHIAFVTFVDPAAAFTFYQVASYQGLTLNNRRLKIGWGKNSGPLPPSLALAVHSGATRNVYVGNIEDFELFNEEKLKRDFGELEISSWNCAFPGICNLRIAHGKDRCANPPRSGPQGGSSVRRSASGNGPASAEPASAIEPIESSQFVDPEDEGNNANVIVSGPEEMEASI